MSALVRLFWAIELPEGHRRRLVRIASAPGNEPRVQWVALEKVHLTLKFLGDLEEDLVSRVVDSGVHASRGIGTISLTLTEPGSFPGHGAPKVLFWGVGGDLDRLSFLARRLDEAMESFGVERESRPFRPHVTLGRVRPPRGGRSGSSRITTTWWRERVGTKRVEAGDFEVTEVVLFASTLTSEGPIYAVRGRVSLAEGKGDPAEK